MRTTLRTIAVGLGQRPGLLVALLFIWGACFCTSVLMFLAHTGGIPLFDLSTAQTVTAAGGIIVIVAFVVLWRAWMVNQIISKALGLEQYETFIDGGFYHRLLHISRISPVPLANLVSVLLIGSMVLANFYLVFRDAQPGTMSHLVFENMPWIWICIAGVSLIYNDIQVLETLKTHFRSVPVEMDAQMRSEHLRVFLRTLTAMEYRCFQHKHFDLLRNKDIALALHLSESTVKTHINNMNRKWEQYARAHGLPADLKTFAKGLHVEIQTD